MKFYLRTGAVCALALSTAAHADPVPWTLNNAVFSDGGTATGSFVWDADTMTFGAYHFTVSGGETSIFAPAEYGNALESAAPFYDANVKVFIFSIASTDPTISALERTLYLAVPDDLPGGGTVSLVVDPTLTFFSTECYSCAPFRPLVSGSLTAPDVTAVPEPMSWAMMMFGFGGIGGVMCARPRVSRVSFAG